MSTSDTSTSPKKTRTKINQAVRALSTSEHSLHYYTSLFRHSIYLSIYFNFLYAKAAATATPATTTAPATEARATFVLAGIRANIHGPRP